MPWLRRHAPGRYLEFVVGYGARAYAAENAGRVAPSRHVYLGVALNLSEILRATAYRRDTRPSRTQCLTETFFEHVQLPGTAAVADRRL